MALPHSVNPRLSGADVVSAQQRPAVPAAIADGLIAGMRPHPGTLAQSLALVAPAAPSSDHRLHAAGPLSGAMPVFIPQAAVPRTHDMLAAGAPRISVQAMPVAGASGFTRNDFSLLAFQAAAIESRPLAPQPVPVPVERLAYGQPRLSLTPIAVEAPAGALPIELYVRRVRTNPRRVESEWRAYAASAAIVPIALPGLWPARFEQQVLQDWRRRHPARQAAVAPSPIIARSKVLPIAQHRNFFQHLRSNAAPYVKGIAAAAMISAVAWLAWSAKGVQATFSTDRQWLRSAISQRAAFVVDDNFRSGLNLWEGRKNWAQSWSHSSDGFMRTGQLALYRPTLQMRDYRLEFFTQIEDRSVGWVARAKNEQNYYAMKLSVTNPGPRPMVSVVRYPVTNGIKGKKVQVPLPIMIHNNTPYHVALDVKGSHFRAFIEDQEVDSWNDDSHRSGGVGFFSEGGERARLYWVKVSNNTDWLGRLCGMIAGSSQTSEEGSLWNPDEDRGQIAALDPNSILDSGKNVDRRRGAPMLPIALVFLGDSF